MATKAVGCPWMMATIGTSRRPTVDMADVARTIAPRTITTPMTTMGIGRRTRKTPAVADSPRPAMALA